MEPWTVAIRPVLKQDDAAIVTKLIGAGNNDWLAGVCNQAWRGLTRENRGLTVLRFELPSDWGRELSTAIASGPVAKASLDDIRHETERNHEVFRQLVGELLADHSGAYALMKSGRVIEFFSKDVDALKAGEARFPDRLYSIHRIRARTDRLPSLNGAVSVHPLRR